MKRTIFLLVLIACLSIASSAGAASRSESRWRASTEHAYLSNCAITSHGNVAKCRCTLRILEKRYTEAQMTSLYLHHQARLLVIMRQTWPPARSRRYAPSTTTSGSCSLGGMRSNVLVHLGIHQLASPSRRISAGTSKARMTVASKMIPAARPIARDLIS
jgi:hypothetical protein